jgi:3-deoxy-D-manno-octulosonic acid kinase
VAESSTSESLISIGKQHILYDASLVEHPNDELFDLKRMKQDAAMASMAEGRGHAVFFRHQEHEFVLKHYQRGGSMAALLGDKYIGLGCNKSRSFREWRLLKYMREAGLPVPSPVAARCISNGVYYRADLITIRIGGVTTLADYLFENDASDEVWMAVGSCIRRFHDASVYHADLNARNILVNPAAISVYLIDFDKGAIRFIGDSWKAANLARLQRSLLKFKSLRPSFSYSNVRWQRLLDGYNAC